MPAPQLKNLNAKVKDENTENQIAEQVQEDTSEKLGKTLPAPIGPAPSGLPDKDARKEIEDRKQSCLDMIGVRVHYYDGDGIGGTPSAATVVKALMNGCVDLRVLHPGGGEGMDKKAVRHISDPRLKVNEHFRKTGCWDYTWYEKYPEKFKQVVKETCSTND